MGDYGIKVSKPGQEVDNPVSDDTTKDFAMLDASESPKVYYRGFATGGSYTHSLGSLPLFFAFEVDSTSAPTYFEYVNDAYATTTELTDLPDPAYIIIFHDSV
jgi:hypothetical protein